MVFNLNNSYIMRSKIAQRILDRTPKETKIFVSKYADIVIRVNEILEKKKFNLEENVNQPTNQQSEICKWLHGEHDFTLHSISKLEAELGETILEVCKPNENIESEKNTIFSKENIIKEDIIKQGVKECPTKNTISIKKATIEDIENLNLIFNNYRVFYKKESDLEASKEFLRQRIENKESEIFIAHYSTTPTQKQIIGFVQLYPIFSSTRLKRLWLLNDLFVEEDFRGKGISVLLIEEAKKLAIQTSSAGLMLETDKNNVQGNNLYPKTGFKLDTEHNFYYWEE